MFPTTTSPRVFVETIEDVTVASFADAEIITDDVLSEVDEQLMVLAASLGTPKVLLNFRGVRTMTSTLLGVLMKFSRRVTGARGRLKLCGIAPHLLEVFQITRFDRVFEIHADENQALDSFA